MGKPRYRRGKAPAGYRSHRSHKQLDRMEQRIVEQQPPQPFSLSPDDLAAAAETADVSTVRRKVWALERQHGFQAVKQGITDLGDLLQQEVRPVHRRTRRRSGKRT